MTAGRRSRRAGGRQAVIKSSVAKKKAGGTASGGKGARKAAKAAMLSAARERKDAARVAAPTLLALIPVGQGNVGAVGKRIGAAGTGVECICVGRGAGVEDGEWVRRCLDAAKVCDFVVFVFGEDEVFIDAVGLEAVAALRAQGMPGVASIAAGGGGDKRERGRVLEAESLGSAAELRPFGIGDGEIDGFLRRIKGRKGKGMVWRKKYGYLRVEEARAVEGGLEISGVVRGAGIGVEGLVMITGVGAFGIEKISEVGGKVLGVRSAEAEDANSVVSVDEMAGEQTWPPEEEGDPTEELVRKKVPKGYSAYQAAWLDGSDALAEEGEEDGKDGDATMVGDGESDKEAEEDEEDEESAERDAEEGSVSQDAGMDDGDSDVEVDAEEVARVRAAAAAAQENAAFPDEVDTPIDTPARTRFARYRGLKSFRTSTWDAKEQLPRPYARLFQFADLPATRKRVLAEAVAAVEKGTKTASAGTRVVITLLGVPADVAKGVVETVEEGVAPVVASGMLRHENRRSVVHFGVQRVDDDVDEGGLVVKAKDPMEMHCGFARFTGKPMYSEQNANSDKHKMERYLVHGRFTVASFYGPSVYAPAPALLFRPNGGSLVASGSALGADPDRIILKRIVLTGYPYKTLKKRTVVKFMFFNPEDVRWFRPVELWSKLGRTGHIVSPIGEHGKFKAVFDAPVQFHDTVMLTLYKRVYPKLILDQDADKQ